VFISDKGALLLEEQDIVYLIKEKIGLKNFLLQLMESLEAGFKKFASKKITVPARYEFLFPHGSIVPMSAADDEYFACKIVNTHPENSIKYNMPTVMGTGILVDVQTGYPTLLIESTILTALRTAITSAIATKYLANKKSKILGIIGNGAEAMPHLHAISLIRDINEVYAFDVDEKAAKSFKNSAERLMNGGAEIRLSNAETTSIESDILVTITNNEMNRMPVVFSNWIRDGTHINAVGGCSANQIELEKSLLERAKVIVDFKDQAIYEGESQQLPKGKIYADLSDIIVHNKEPRTKEDEVTIFDSVGFAMEDLQAFKLIYELSIKEGIGKRVNIAAKPRYSKNLYQSYFLN